MIFFFIVRSVVSLVSLFREFYIEHYNNKKFLFLKILFVTSIFVLVRSRGRLNLIMGWDWLGVSSLFLIIFYPNKLTLYNSYLTIIFNRLGDVILIFIFCLFLMSFHNFIFFFEPQSKLILILLIICAFTKRAQYPLSSWLPAAMAAPTPISAMVHSSTLVTAGLFILGNLSFYISLRKLNTIFLLASLIRFLQGGAMAKVEIDFKKIVAFSTLSQIRIISFFFFLGLLILGIWHIVLHAFFKTALFCCCGAFFIINLSDQYFKKIRFFCNSNNMTNLILFFSIFRITGLAFRRSFFSKDKVVEFLGVSSQSFFFILVLGRVLTLIYRRKILEILKKKVNVISFKKELFLFFVIFSLVTLFLGKLIILIFLSFSFPICRIRELILILVLLSLAFFVETCKFSNWRLKYFTLEISFIKRVTFRIWSHSTFFVNPKIFSSDIFIFNPGVLRVSRNSKHKIMRRNRIYTFYYFILFFFIYF